MDVYQKYLQYISNSKAIVSFTQWLLSLSKEEIDTLLVNFYKFDDIRLASFFECADNNDSIPAQYLIYPEEKLVFNPFLALICGADCYLTYRYFNTDNFSWNNSEILYYILRGRGNGTQIINHIVDKFIPTLKFGPRFKCRLQAYLIILSAKPEIASQPKFQALYRTHCQKICKIHKNEHLKLINEIGNSIIANKDVMLLKYFSEEQARQWGFNTHIKFGADLQLLD